jgi:hypothetical protein
MKSKFVNPCCCSRMKGTRREMAKDNKHSEMYCQLLLEIGQINTSTAVAVLLSTKAMVCFHKTTDRF